MAHPFDPHYNVVSATPSNVILTWLVVVKLLSVALGQSYSQRLAKQIVAAHIVHGSSGVFGLLELDRPVLNAAGSFVQVDIDDGSKRQKQRVYRVLGHLGLDVFDLDSG